MKWKKAGLIYGPNTDLWWQQYYAMMPTPVYMEDEGIIRIFFGTTDKDRFGRLTYIDVDAENPSRIVNNPGKILADLGKEGAFDDSGVIPSSAIVDDEGVRLYYVGFQRTVKVPYMLFSGLMESRHTDVTTFRRFSEAPIIDRDIKNIYSNAAPFVMKDGVLYKMWFWEGREWVTISGKKYIRAVISYAESADGYNWEIILRDCIVPKESTEFSVGRPWVIREDGIYKMWYSVRYVEKLYRIGYAESNDGKSWERKDEEINLDVSDEGWDCEMICYPAVINVKDRKYMFYNGNNNGETGFGYAELLDNISQVN